MAEKTMKQYITENLICPNCSANLETLELSDEICCVNCGTNYPIIDHIPVIFNEEESIFSYDDFKAKKNLFFDISQKGRLISITNKFIPSLGKNWVSKKNYKILSDLLLSNKSHSKVLILGGSIEGDGIENFLHEPRFNIVESDVSFGPRTQIILDGHCIPYADSTFDCVIVQAVLEHVIDPHQCVKEIHRVLNHDGLVYSETPFLQQVHGGAFDFTRFTRSGHRFLFKNFEEIKSGMTAGPGTVMLWNYEYLLLSIFGFNKIATLITKAFARITGFWMPYFDLLVWNNKRAADSASGLFFIGKKSQYTMSSMEIIKYYK